MADRFSNKQPYEAYYVEFDFTTDLEATTVFSATVTAIVVSTGADATVAITQSAKQMNKDRSVLVWVYAGTTGTEYKITCRIVATDGSQYEMDGILPVVEK